MAFNYNSTTFVSFAVYADVTARDQRFFEANEGLDSTTVNALLAQASQRILTQIRNTQWYREGAFALDPTLNNDLRSLPAVNPDYIEAREQEFKDLNVYFAMYEYLLPRVADFGNENSAEVVKIAHYKDGYDKLFKEVIESGDWYDFSGNGTITTNERRPSTVNLIRIR
jgi:hypothetical protein